MKNRKIELNTDLRAGEILSLVGIIVLAIMIGMILSSQVFTVAGVREVSMEDTLFEGERIFVNKLAYRGSIPERGDVVIFLKGEEIDGFFDRCGIALSDMARNIGGNERDNRLVKRVIGLPGETIEIRDGKVFINGQELNEPYVKNVTFPNHLDGPYNIPDDSIFVMGDNRIWSSDSRHFGPVSLKSIEGKATSVIWPPSEWIGLDFEYNNID